MSLLVEGGLKRDLSDIVSLAGRNRTVHGKTSRM